MDSNKRRVMVVIVVVFVVVLSFFAGRYTKGKPYAGTDDVNTNAPATSADKVGVPPDSLHH